MKQITIMIDDDQQAEKIVEMLSDFDTIRSIDIDPLWMPPGDDASLIKIIETDSAPMISESRVSVYDVMKAHDEGYSLREIRDTYNLSFYQVEVALAYIEQHRATLEPKLKEIQIKLAEREKYYRALAAERERTIPSIMTPARQTLKALIEKSRRERGAI
jgi:uncharacterized protein (DUF433 family)